MIVPFRRLVAAGTAVALFTAPTLAAAAPTTNAASSLSIAKSVRAGSPAAKSSKIGAAVPTATLISIGVLAALVGIVLAVTGDDDDSDSN